MIKIELTIEGLLTSFLEPRQSQLPEGKRGKFGLLTSFLEPRQSQCGQGR